MTAHKIILNYIRFFVAIATLVFMQKQFHVISTSNLKCKIFNSTPVMRKNLTHSMFTCDLTLCSPTDSYIAKTLDRRERLLQMLESKSSTDSESGSRTKLHLSDYAPVALTKQDLFQILEPGAYKNEKMYVLNAILQSRFDNINYIDILRILQENLNEDDDEVFTIALEVHEKFMKSSWETLKETFISLLETLYIHYFDLPYDIKIEKYPYKNTFRIYKIVLDTLNEVTFHTPNVGHSRLEKIIGNFVDLVFFTTKILENLSPLNIVSSLDPTANWCKSVLYNANTREILFKCMKRNKNLLACVFLVISNWMCDPGVPKCKELSHANIKFATFVNCIHCCTHLSHYKSFNEFFPIVIENKFVISLNSFVTSLISFLKSRSRSVPTSIVNCMIECSVYFLRFLSIDLMVSQLQSIVEMCNVRHARKNLFEIIRRLLDDRAVVDTIMNFATHSRSCLSSGGKLRRPKLYSSNNIFVNLINTLGNVIRKDYHSLEPQIFGIIKNIFESHGFYLICGPDSFLLSEFIELLASKRSQKKLLKWNGSENVTREKEYLFAIGSTPLGFYFLSKTDKLLKTVLLHMEKQENSWSLMPWKRLVPFIVTSEERSHSRTYRRNLCLEILTIVYQILEMDATNENEFRRCYENIIILVDTISYNADGIFMLMNSTPNENNNENKIKNFAQFIQEYALAPSHEYKIQHVALLSLQTMVHNFNVRIFLLNFLNYEENLRNIQNHLVTEEGELIEDECSLLRRQLLAENFHNDFASDLSRVQSASKVKLCRKKISDIEKFLLKTRHGPYDGNWLKYARKSFRSSLSNNLKMSIILELIEKTIKSTIRTVRLSQPPIIRVTDSPTLQSQDYRGISLTVRFGIKNQILHENSTNEQNLATVIKSIKNFSGDLNTDESTKFDCTLSTIFLVCEGSVERSLNIISYIIPLPVSVFIWPQVTPSSTKKRYLFGHLLEWILYQEVPNVFFSLMQYGISWWLICKNELENCFWSTMAWTDVCRWLCITILHPWDNLIYFFTGVALKNEFKILQAANEFDLRNILHVMFGLHRLEEYFGCIDHLSRKYHSYLASFLKD